MSTLSSTSLQSTAIAPQHALQSDAVDQRSPAHHGVVDLTNSKSELDALKETAELYQGEIVRLGNEIASRTEGFRKNLHAQKLRVREMEEQIGKRTAEYEAATQQLPVRREELLQQRNAAYEQYKQEKLVLEERVRVLDEIVAIAIADFEGNVRFIRSTVPEAVEDRVRDAKDKHDRELSPDRQRLEQARQNLARYNSREPWDHEAQDGFSLLNRAVDAIQVIDIALNNRARERARENEVMDRTRHQLVAGLRTLEDEHAEVVQRYSMRQRTLESKLHAARQERERLRNDINA